MAQAEQINCRDAQLAAKDARLRKMEAENEAWMRSSIDSAPGVIPDKQFPVVPSTGKPADQRSDSGDMDSQVSRITECVSRMSDQEAAAVLAGLSTRGLQVSHLNLAQSAPPTGIHYVSASSHKERGNSDFPAILCDSASHSNI